MDDVLISHLPAPILRSSLRTMISQGLAAQAVFVEHVRKRLLESPPPLTPPKELFGGNIPRHSEFLTMTRCLFSSKLAFESFPYLTHFVRAIPESQARWKADDSLDLSFQDACGDIVQAVQALKESQPNLTNEHYSSLVQLQVALDGCEAYCASSTPPLPYPFRRAQRQVEDLLSLKFPGRQGAIDSANSGISLSLRPSRNNIGPNHLKLPTVTIDSVQFEKLEFSNLGTVNIPRLINGLWQLSSPAWGSASSEKQNEALSHLVKAGLVAADMADHYGDAELIYGAFRNGLPQHVSQQMVVATKWCVFRPLGKPVTAQLVLEAVMERYRRVGGRLELLQFHWYDYRDKEYLQVLLELVKLTKSHPYIVSEIGLCNFDAKHTEEACAFLLNRTGKAGIVSNQVQFSLVDGRPLLHLTNVCRKYGIKLLTYGSFCGGFLSDKWLGRAAPDIYFETPQLTPSQRKYFDMILLWGTWEDFQCLLRILKEIADKHDVEISNVATRWILDHIEVGAVIVGTRLGVSCNVQSNVKVFSFALDEEDKARLKVLRLEERVEAVFGRIGDCGHEYQKA
ncbi:aldo/keto reductase [Marasmius fiardii PR-910]|nr:aldo/keto reductase [Marasmius fiardii PR-910]